MLKRLPNMAGLKESEMKEHSNPLLPEPKIDSLMKTSATLPAWALPMSLGSPAIHPFVDGNKRAAFAALGVFLGKNGWGLVADQTDASNTILAVAAGELSEEMLVHWISKHLVKTGEEDL